MSSCNNRGFFVLSRCGKVGNPPALGAGERWFKSSHLDKWGSSSIGWALALQAKGWGFKSLLLHISRCSSIDRVLAFQARSCGFEPHYLLKKTRVSIGLKSGKYLLSKKEWLKATEFGWSKIWIQCSVKAFLHWVLLIQLVYWSSLEWTLPCHGRDHGFKSHIDRSAR